MLLFAPRAVRREDSDFRAWPPGGRPAPRVRDGPRHRRRARDGAPDPGPAGLGRRLRDVRGSPGLRELLRRSRVCLSARLQHLAAAEEPRSHAERAREAQARRPRRGPVRGFVRADTRGFFTARRALPTPRRRMGEAPEGGLVRVRRVPLEAEEARVPRPRIEHAERAPDGLSFSAPRPFGAVFSHPPRSRRRGRRDRRVRSRPLLPGRRCARRDPRVDPLPRPARGERRGRPRARARRRSTGSVSARPERDAPERGLRSARSGGAYPRRPLRSRGVSRVSAHGHVCLRRYHA